MICQELQTKFLLHIGDFSGAEQHQRLPKALIHEQSIFNIKKVCSRLNFE